MSKIREEKVVCPECGTKIPFAVHESVNVTLDPTDKERLDDGSLFDAHCVKCGKTFKVFYPFLYHDMDKRQLIMVCEELEAAKAWNPYACSGDLALGAMEKWMPDYTVRSVWGVRELLEKLRIFENGLDDYTVEALKLAVLGEYPDDCDVGTIEFLDMDAGSLRFAVQFHSSDVEFMGVRKIGYDRLFKGINETGVRDVYGQCFYIDGERVFDLMREKLEEREK